jgi:hypothetical protein
MTTFRQIYSSQNINEFCAETKGQLDFDLYAQVRSWCEEHYPPPSDSDGPLWRVSYYQRVHYRKFDDDSKQWQDLRSLHVQSGDYVIVVTLLNDLDSLMFKLAFGGAQ